MARPLPCLPLWSITKFPQPQARILPRAVPGRTGVTPGHLALPQRNCRFFIIKNTIVYLNEKRV